MTLLSVPPAAGVGQQPGADGLTLTPASGTPGSSVAATGAGLGCNGLDDVGDDGPLVVQWDDGTELASLTTTEAGTFETEFATPQDADRGDHVVVARCTQTGDVARAVFTVALLPTLNLAPDQGPADTPVTASGGGLDCNGPNQAGRAGPLFLRWDGGTELATTSTSEDGTFVADFTVPAFGEGDHEVTAACAQTEESVTAGFLVRPMPTLGLSASSGHVADTVTAQGTGFTCESGPPAAVELLWDDSAIARATTNQDDRFTVAFTVPHDAPNGRHAVAARCEDAPEQGAGSSFEVVPPISPTPSLRLAPDTGAASTTVVVTGQGYPQACVQFTLSMGSAQVPVRVDALRVDPATGTVVMSGRFDVPASSTRGPHPVTLDCTSEDGVRLTSASATFTATAAASETGGRWWWVLLAVVLLVLAAALAVGYLRRVARDKRLLRERVAVRSVQGTADTSVEQIGSELPHSLQLAAHGDPGTRDVEEIAR